MSAEELPEARNETSQVLTVDEIDFSQYRTPELTEAVCEIVGLAGLFWTFFKWTGIVVCVFVVSIFVVYRGELTEFWLTIAELLGVIFGCLIGAALGIAQVLARSFSQMLRLIDVLFSTTSAVAADFVRIKSGAARVPSPGKMVRLVNVNVIIPVMEKAVFSSLSIFALPLVWGYRLTFGRLIRVVVSNWVPETWLMHSKADKRHGEKLVADYSATINEIGENKEQITGCLETIRETIVKRGGQVKWLVIWPMYAFVATFFVLLTSVLLIGIQLVK